MAKLICFLVSTLWLVNCQDHDNVVSMNMNSFENDSNKDMYVIHAMVYQVGILTNSSNYKDLENDTQTGAQEDVTFYRSNGSSLDLGSIPQPLLTNVTGQSVVGLAPISDASGYAQLPWSVENGRAAEHTRNKRDTEDTAEDDSTEHPEPAQEPAADDTQLTNLWIRRIRKRDAKEGNNNSDKLVKVVNGNAVIPPGAGIQSVALPPLLSLNNNFSDIPVPIPNTSIVHYARINTLITSANGTM